MSQQPLGYTNYDYDDLVNSLEQRLQQAPDSAWKDMYESGTGQMLIELFAAIGTLVLYYVERRAEESYIQTAQNLSSVINLVRLIGYTPRRNVSAKGNLQFTIPVANTNDVTVPKWTSLSSVNGYNFLTSSEITFRYPATSVTTTGIQGVLKTVSYSSGGGVNQTYNINDTLIENDNIEVSVNGTVWTPVTSFADSINTSMHYVLRTELNQTVTVVFGNGSFGIAPSAGSTIVVTYIQSDGLAGNAYSTGLITRINDTIYDDAHNIQAITVTNSTTFLGGDDAETIDDIRANAPDVFATGQRAVTKADFKAILKDYPGIADAIVFGENDRNPPNYDYFNQVEICVILQNWILPSPTFQAALTSHLYSKSLITVRYSYLDPEIIYVVPCMKVVLTPGASQSYVEGLIKNAVDSQFVLGSTTLLGQSKYESDITHAVENVIGVDHCHVTMKLQKSLQQGFLSAYDFAENMDLLPAVAGKVELWIDNEQIAVDDGANGWTDLSTYTVTGVVNYTSPGLVGANISPAPDPGSAIYIRYQQDEDGDLVLTNNQICKNLPIVYISIS